MGVGLHEELSISIKRMHLTFQWKYIKKLLETN